MPRLFYYIVIAVLFMTAMPVWAKAPVYDVDKSHTNILFFVSHAGFSKMVGEFKEYEGQFEFDSQRPEESSVNITLYPKGIETDSTGLNEHLQKADFFNTEKFPEIKFISKKIEKTGDNNGKLTGDLTMLGVTKPVTFDVIFNKEGEFFNSHRAGFTARASLKRSDFGMNYGLDNIGDQVDILIEAEAVRHDKK